MHNKLCCVLSYHHLRQGTESPGFVGLSSLGGDDGIRTHDPLLAGQVLSQLSYTPIKMVRSYYLRFLFRKFLCLPFFSKKVSGRPKWTRTTDLVLIRHAL